VTLPLMAARSPSSATATWTGIRHRGPEGDAGPRSQRLRDRPAPQPAQCQSDRRRRPDDRRGRAVRRHGPFANAARKPWSKALEGRGCWSKSNPQPQRRALLPLQKVVEPNLSTQWFVKAKPLAEKAIAAVENRANPDHPGNWTQTYYDWMENIRDWCISRQIWWGHQIPAWTCRTAGKWWWPWKTRTAAPSAAAALVQETDVLDTWFSSALWPFSTMGWPEQTPAEDLLPHRRAGHRL
jgi:valyl-tRNA synthetase